MTDADAEQLRALGYTPQFDRSMSIWQNFALGFTYLSPVVGVYTIFASSFAVGGPPMWWSYLLVGLGQLLVCLVFGEVVSQFPISGGLYPWARRLVGRRWAWMAGWIYGCALCVSVAAVATGAAPFVAQLLFLPDTAGTDTTIAIGLIVLTTALNLRGTKLLGRLAMFGFICELIGAGLVGAVLLAFARHRGLGALLDVRSVAPTGNYLPGFLASAVAAMFCYYGFEACGDVAEETPNASVAIPKAMIMTIVVGGAAAMFVCLALVLAVPDVGAVVSGRDKDPVTTTLRAALGEIGLRGVVAIVMVSFISCLLSLQAAASRLLFAYARDRMIVGSRVLSRLSPRTHMPTAALLAAGIAPALIALAGQWLTNAIATIISFAAIGIYLAFQMIVLGALIARARGWRPAGAFTLGRWGGTVNILALCYGIAAIIDMAWPRSPADPWYSNYAITVTSAAVLTLGALYMLIARPFEHSGDLAAGDASGLH
jgi:amino acid transporter